MSARQRSKRGNQGSDDEMYYGYDEYGDLYGGFELEPEEVYPPPEGKWGMACLACGMGGDVACCEVGGQGLKVGGFSMLLACRVLSWQWQCLPTTRAHVGSSLPGIWRGWRCGLL